MGRKKAGIFQFDNSPVFGFRRQDIYSRKIALIRLFIDSGSFPACRRSCSEKKIREKDQGKQSAGIPACAAWNLLPLQGLRIIQCKKQQSLQRLWTLRSKEDEAITRTMDFAEQKRCSHAHAVRDWRTGLKKRRC